MNDPDKYIKGRGAQINPPNPFDNQQLSDPGQHWHDEDEHFRLKSTQYILTHPKTMINKVTSPDLGFAYSMNPYQGCEHGCVYCYARNTHNYWGYSAGIDFEQKILIKKEAPSVLDKKLQSPKWKVAPIMLSGNTDCYQPAEREFKLTREILKVCLKHKHPIRLITKNTLICRDLDILTQLAAQHLVQVALSVTSLDEDVRLRLEPRTASGAKRIDVIRKLSDANIPASMMIAPIIPSINDHEINGIAKQGAEAGALAMSYTIVRLNGAVGDIFKDWLEKNYPDKQSRVINQISQCHGGQINDSQFGRRMKGEGPISDIIKQQIEIARTRYYTGRSMPPLDHELFNQLKSPQLKLF